MHHISWSIYEFDCLCLFFFLLPSFSLLGSALGFFLLKGSFSLTPSGFCSDYGWFSILVRGTGRWLDGQGLFWRMMISHVCSCVCASWLSARLQMAQCLIIGRSGNTHTNNWLHEHGKWSRLNLQSRVPVTCLDLNVDNLNLSPAKPWKRITMCLSAMWHWLRQHTLVGVMLQGCWCAVRGRHLAHALDREPEHTRSCNCK